MQSFHKEKQLLASGFEARWMNKFKQDKYYAPNEVLYIICNASWDCSSFPQGRLLNVTGVWSASLAVLLNI